MAAANDLELQLVIDSIPAMAWSARADGTGEFFNRRYLDYVGRTLEQVRDWQWTSVIHPDDLGTVAAAWEQLRDAPADSEVEVRMRRHDGVYRWFSFRANPVCDSSGAVVKWYGINVDIDEQKRAAILLEGERQLLELIAHSRPLGEILGVLCRVVEQTLPGCHCEVRVADTSNTLYELALAPSLPQGFIAAVVGAPLAGDISPPGMAATGNVTVIAEDLETDPRWHDTAVQAQLVGHGLKSAWVTPFSSNTGSMLGTLAVYHRSAAAPQPEHHDIIERLVRLAVIAIERLRAEHELRRREYLLATSERISETGSFAWDLNADKVIFSEQMRRIFELDDSFDLVRPDLRALYHPDDLPHVDHKIACVFRGEQCPENEERLLMPDGRIKYSSTAFRVIHHDDGRRECIGVLQDVTRRRLAEDALDKVRSELAHITRVTSLGELTASIAHEVNQPLSGIITNSSACLRMLASNPPDIERVVKAVQRTIRDGNRASEVIKRLRGLFRRQDFSPEPFNLNEAAQEVIAICSHDLQRRRISLGVNLNQALSSVVGDRIQLQQVILNLVLNAADAVGASDHQPRQIAIETAELMPGIAQLTVRDTGIGIAEGALARIFEAFYTTKPNGMGIGLSVSKSILERHGGKLWASANNGPGSAFSFCIPSAPP